MTAERLKVSQPLSLAPILVCVVIATIRGANPIAIKVVLQSMPPLLGAFMRISIASAGIGIYAASRRISLKPKRRELLPLALLAVIFAVQIGSNQTGADFTSPVLLAILFNTYPITTNLISSFVIPEDGLNLRRVTGLAAAFAGVAWILTASTESALAPNPTLGNSLVLVASTLLAIRMVYTRQLALHVDYVKTVFWPLVGALPLFLLGWVTIPDPIPRTDQDWTTWAALFFQGLVVGGAGQLIWVYLIRRHTPGTVIAFSFITPVSGVALSSAYFGEPVPVQLLVGLGAVLLGIGLAARRAQIQEPQKPPNPSPGTSGVT